MLKVLGLHGYGANGKFIEEYQAKDLKLLFPFLDMEFLDGPFDMPPHMVRDRTLHKLMPDKKFKSWKKTTVLENRHITKLPSFDEGIQTIIDNIERVGGIDGLLGFSMGGAVVMSFLLGIENGTIDIKYKPKFVILVASGVTSYPITRTISIPSIHIAGELDGNLYGDEVATSTHFLNPLVILHEEGHKFPTFARSDVNKMMRYLKPILLKKHPELLWAPRPKL